MHFVFLHGFLSSPESSKIAILSKALREDPEIQVTETHALDLYPTKQDFESLSFTALLDDVKDYINDLDGQVILIGSSHGGLLAAWLAGTHPDLIDGLVLLAPALYYRDILQRTQNIDEWQRRGYILMNHPRFEGQSKLPITYYRTLDQYQTPDFKLSMPTVLIHGELDKSVPVDHSYHFVDNQPKNVEAYFPLRGDHRLSNVMDQVTATILQWCKDNY